MTRVVNKIRSSYAYLDNLTEGCQIIGFDWRYLYSNDAAVRHGRRAKNELMGKKITEIYPGIAETEMFSALQQSMDKRIPNVLENEFTFPDGNKAWFELRIDPVPEGIFILSLDRTEYMHTIEKLEDLNSKMQTIRKVNQLIAVAEDESELLQKMCDSLVAGCNYKMVWIGFIFDGSYYVLPVAQAGFTEDYLSSIRITWDDSESGSGPAGTAIRTGRSEVIRDILNDTRYQPWRKQALKRGYASSIAIPLLIEGKIGGVLNVYSGYRDAFDTAETDMLTELAGDLAIGIGKIRQRGIRQRMGKELEMSAHLLNAATDAIYVYDLDGNFIYVNEAICKSLGYSRAELMTRNSKEIIASPSLDRRQQHLRELEVKREIVFEAECLHKDGSTNPVEVHARLIELDGRDIVLNISHDITERLLIEHKLEEGARKLGNVLGKTVQAIAAITEMRDPYTAGHQWRVARLACSIARELKLPEEQMQGLHVASTVHDVGKMHIPAEILSKPSKLTESEFDIIKTHPKAGYEILKPIEFPWPVARIVLQHHERMNGSGYPDGLLEGDILLEARILGVADVVEAMSSHRPYRPALGIEHALQDIQANSGILYDPEVVAACVQVCRSKEFEFDEISYNHGK